MLEVTSETKKPIFPVQNRIQNFSFVPSLSPMFSLPPQYFFSEFCSVTARAPESERARFVFKPICKGRRSCFVYLFFSFFPSSSAVEGTEKKKNMCACSTRYLFPSLQAVAEAATDLNSSSSLFFPLTRISPVKLFVQKNLKSKSPVQERNGFCLRETRIIFS